VDSSGNGHSLLNSGVSSSGSIFGGAPGSGSALFDGSSFMQTASTLNLSSYNQLTIEFYLRTTDTDLSLLLEHSANYNTSSPGGFAAVLNSAGGGGTVPGSLEFSLHTTTGAYNNRVTPFDPADWHHYAVRLDRSASAAGRIQLYIDGQAVGSMVNANGNSPTFLNDFLYIGSRAGNSLFATCELDELRISDLLLTPGEFLPVPEPGSISLAVIGGLLLVWIRFRRP
jgi:hypothetical protein